MSSEDATILFDDSSAEAKLINPLPHTHHTHIVHRFAVSRLQSVLDPVELCVDIVLCVLVSFEALPDGDRAHHMILFACSEPETYKDRW